MENNRVRSLTVRQLSHLPDVDIVTLVGRIAFVPGSNVSWMFELDDGTGVVRGSRNCVSTRIVDDVEERIKQESNQMLDAQTELLRGKLKPVKGRIGPFASVAARGYLCGPGPACVLCVFGKKRDWTCVCVRAPHPHARA